MDGPLAIDLYAGLGGWTDGLLAEGFRVVGFDIERHVYGEARYPAQLVLQDVLTLDGAQFKDAALIVASPSCQEYSYMAMPWTRAKQIARALRGQGEFPEGYTGSRTVPELTALFDACFRLQREAIAAAGHFIPLVVENVRGACPWVGRSKWNFGSFHLWGDVPTLMPMTSKRAAFKGGDRFDGSGGSFQTAAVEGTKNDGGSWFNIGSPGQKETGRNPVHELASQKLNDVDGYEREHPAAFGWKVPRTSSHSQARKAASAAIARIPFTLAQWIARAYTPALRRGEGR